MAEPDDILRQYAPQDQDEHGFLISRVGGQLKFNPWEAVKGFMGHQGSPGSASTSGDLQPIRDAADVAGWAMAPSLGLNWAGMGPSNSVGIFGGRLGADTLAQQGIPAPKKAIEMAERMRAAGADRDEIWRETASMMQREDPRFSAVHFGKDEMPRFEIPDYNAQWPQRMEDAFARRAEAVTAAHERLDHPLLWSAYPELQEMPFRAVARPNKPMEGIFQPPDPDHPFGYIEAAGSNPQRARSAALHEYSHGVANVEGHARGSNTDIAPGVFDDPTREMKHLMSDYRALRDIFDKTALNHPDMPALVAEMKNLNDMLQKGAIYEGYRRSAGETEARNVQKRMLLRPDELRARPPWETQDVPDAQQILEMYGAPRGVERSVEIPLPMDEASKLARAREMGFDTDNVWYHGTHAKPFDEFKTGQPAKRWMSFIERDVNSQGPFLSPDKTDAGSYGPNVGEYFTRAEKPLIPPTDIPVSTRDKASMEASKKAWDDFMHIMEPASYVENGVRYIDTDGGVSRMPFDAADWAHYIDWNWLDNPEVVARMKALGYDSAHVAEPNDRSGRSLFVNDTSKIRSTKAAFDPAKKNSRNLLASSGAPVATTADILRQYGEEKE